MKIKIFLLVLACCSIICFVSLSEDADILLNLDHPFQYAVDNDFLWTREQNKIFQYSTTGELLNTFELDDNIEHIASNQGVLYLQCKVESNSYIVEMKCGATVHRKWKLPQKLELQQMEIINDTILFLAGDKNEKIKDSYHSIGHKKLYKISMLTGLVEEVCIHERDNSLITSFTTDGKYIYAIDSMHNELITIDILEGNIIASASIAQFDYICYDKNTCSVFGLVTDSLGTSLIQIDPLNGEFYVAYTLESGYAYAGLRGNQNGLYIGNYTNYDLLNIKTNGFEFPQKQKSIYFINTVESLNSLRLAKATELFRKDYPGFQIVFKNIGEPQTLVKTITSDDSKCDIVSVQEYGGVLSKSLLLSGMICDLNTYPEIVTSLDGWINLDSTFLLAGKRFGLPQDLIPYFWYANEALFSKLQLNLPNDGWTWSDFFALCDRVEQLNQTQDIHYIVLADDMWPYLLRQFYINRVSIAEKKAYFDTSEFRLLISRWKKAFDSKVLSLCSENNNFNNYDDVTLLRVSLGQYALLGDYKFVFPPLLNGTSFYPIQTVTLVLGRNSTKKNEAARFLSYYISPEVVAFLDPCYHGVCLNDITYYSNSPVCNNAVLVSDKNNQYWIRLLEYSSQEQYVGAGYVAKSYTLLTQYMNGEIELDVFVSELQNITDIALRE